MNLKPMQTTGRRIAPAPRPSSTVNTVTVVPMRSREMVTTTEDVTPTMAARWLEKNVINRAISERAVTDYAHDMTMGLWNLTEESIAFDKDGSLVQGQHRLSAVIKSGKTIKMRVTRNAPPILAIRDRGRQRLVGDFLQWADGSLIELDTKRLVSWLGMIQLMKDKAPGRYRVSRCRDLVLEHEPALRWLGENAPHKAVRAPLCAALVYAFPTHESYCKAFLEQYVSGAGLEKGSPVLALRNRAIGAAQPKFGEKHWSERLDAAYQTLTALKAFIKKKSLVRIYKSDEAYLWFKEARERKGLT